MLADSLDRLPLFCKIQDFSRIEQNYYIVIEFNPKFTIWSNSMKVPHVFNYHLYYVHIVIYILQ